MAVKEFNTYIHYSVFLESLVRVYIQKELITQPSPENPDERLVFKNNQLVYRLKQTKEENFPEVGDRSARYSSLLYKLNGNTKLVLETKRHWKSYESIEDIYGSREDKTTLFSKDELGEAMLKDLNALLTPERPICDESGFAIGKIN